MIEKIVNNQTVQKAYATPTHGHVSLGEGLRQPLFWILTVLLFLLVGQNGFRDVKSIRQQIFPAITSAALWGVLVRGVRISAQWERGVILRVGKLQRIRGPGIFYLIPLIEDARFIDTRILVVNIPGQKVITQDNVPALIDSALFFLVRDPARAVTSIQDFRFAMSQYAQAAL